MSIVHDPMKAPISLHGLGFIQVQLQGGQRLHVWHPDLPRRRCFEDSAIHNHRFNFKSQVLIGQMLNINYQDRNANEEDATHILYLHEGSRTERGGRPWTPNAPVVMIEKSRDLIEAGGDYRMYAYDFHRTEPGGDGRVATIMTKLAEGSVGAMSSCRIGIEPDTDFDRFQLSPAELWAYVLDVLGFPNLLACLARAPEQAPIGYTTSKQLKIAGLMPHLGSFKAQCQQQGEWRVPVFIAPQLPKVPEGYALMPSSLTAENGAKGLLLGEFRIAVERTCEECASDEPNPDCEVCDGEVEYNQHVDVPWDTIKEIYAKAVNGLSLLPDNLRMQPAAMITESPPCKGYTTPLGQSENEPPAALAQPDTLLITKDQLNAIRRDLDACQKVIWLAGCRPQHPSGFDPAYVTDAQARLAEIDALLDGGQP